MRGSLVFSAAVLLLAAPIFVLGVVEKQDPVPPIRPDCAVVDRATAIAKSIVGDDFFEKYVQFYTLHLVDTRGLQVSTMERGGTQERYRARPEVYYEVDWQIRFPFGGAPEGATFEMSPDGHLLSDPDEIRLPPCIKHPESCRFSVSPEEAGVIAIKVTKAVGRAQPWFTWSEDFDRYLWVVRILPTGVQGAGECKECKMALVDPNTGEVLMAGDWKPQYSGWR